MKANDVDEPFVIDSEQEVVLNTHPQFTIQTKRAWSQKHYRVSGQQNVLSELKTSLEHPQFYVFLLQFRPTDR